MAESTIFNKPAAYTKPTYASRTANNYRIRNNQAPRFDQWEIPASNSSYNANAGQTNAYGGFEMDSPDVETGGGGGDGFSMGEYGKIAVGALNAYNSYKANQIGRERLTFSKQQFGVNLANQAQLVNNEMESVRRKRLETSGKYSSNTAGQANLQSDLQSYLSTRRVSGNIA